MREERHEGRGGVVTATPFVRTFAGILLAIIGVLVIVLCIIAIRASNNVTAVAGSVAEISDRQTVALAGIAVQAEQNECVVRTQSEWMLALTLALLEVPDSPEQAEAVARLGPIAEELRTINERCYDDNPVPIDQSDFTAEGPSEGENGQASKDGRDGLDGRNGRDSNVPGPPGSDGADSTTPGPPGADGQDSLIPGPAGSDGKDSTVQGPQGPSGESIIGPQGEQGLQGFEGSPPIGWTFTVGGVDYICNDPDGDLLYECSEVEG